MIRASGLQKGDMLLVTAVLEDGDSWRLTIYEDCEYEFEAEVIKLKVKHDAYGEDSLVSVDLINGAKESR